MALMPRGNSACSRAEEWNSITQKINSILNCTLCQLPYKDPKTLPCGHSFCRICLGDFILQQRINENATNYFPCPVCYISCPVPPKLAALPGAAALRTLVNTVNRSTASNHQCAMCILTGKQMPVTYYCSNCEDFLCEECSNMHKKTRLTFDHLLVKITNQDVRHKTASSSRNVCSYFGQHGEDLNNPWGICTNKAGDILVSNDGNDVAVFSTDGTCKKHLNQQPFYGDSSQNPHHPNRCIALTQEGFLVVAIRKKNGRDNYACVAVIESLAGREIGTCATRVDDFTQCIPSGIAVMVGGQIVVSDTGLNCIYIFDNTYKFVRKFGRKGSGNKRFNGPYYITVNNFGEILVSDHGNHCVKIFDIKGNFKRKIGMMGTGRGQLLHPMGICTDIDMNILVADRDNHRVHVFDAAGNYRVIIVEDTIEAGKDIRPMDVAFNNSGCLMVLVKGIEGENFSEIRSYEYDLCEWPHQRNKRLSSQSRQEGRITSAPPHHHTAICDKQSSHGMLAIQDFSNFSNGPCSGRTSYKGGRSHRSPPSGRSQRAYYHPLNFETNFATQHSDSQVTQQCSGIDRSDYLYDAHGYDYNPQRQYPDIKPASKVCSIM